MAQPLTIGRLAKAAGVHVETVRYYQRRGLLKEPSKPPGSHRHYPPAALQRLDFIRRAQQLGFSLDEIKQLLRLTEPGDWPRAQAIAEGRRKALRQKILQARLMLAALNRVIRKGARGGRSIIELIREDSEAP